MGIIPFEGSDQFILLFGMEAGEEGETTSRIKKLLLTFLFQKFCNNFYCSKSL